MKTLILLRHGKSDWGADFSRDHDRPLNPRGERSAKLIGRFLQKVGQVPDAVVASTAVRAHTTAQLAAEAGDWDRTIATERSLYASDPDTVLSVIQGIDDAHGSLLLAGHEPTWSSLAGQLIGQGSLKVVTATLVRIDFFHERWRDINPGTGTLVWMLPPRLLEAAMD